MIESKFVELLDACPFNVLIVDTNFNILGFNFKSPYMFLLDRNLIGQGHLTKDISSKFLLKATILLQSHMYGSEFYVNRKLNESQHITQETLFECLTFFGECSNDVEFKELVIALKLARKAD